MFAYLSEHDGNHEWAVNQLASISGPLVTCEPVLAEASHLILGRGGNLQALWGFLREGLIQLPFRLESEFESIATLMQRYSDVPMDLADACLVRLSEQHRDCRVFTTDRDFKIYRRFGRQVIPLIFPS